MKKKLSRLLCLALCAAMVCCLLPIAALAADTAPDGFADFEELKAIAAGTYEDFPFISYTGEGELTIQEDLTIPSGVMIEVDNKVIIPEGVTLTVSEGSHFYCADLAVQGKLISNAVYFETFSTLSVTGSIENNGSFYCMMDSGVDLSKISNGESGMVGLCMYVNSADDIYEAASVASLQSDNAVIYEIYITRSAANPDIVLSDSLTVPQRMSIHVNQGTSLTIDTGCTMTLDGCLISRSDIILNGTLENNGSVWLNSIYIDAAYCSGTLTVADSGSYTGGGGLEITKGNRTDVGEAVTGLDMSDFIIDDGEIAWVLYQIGESEYIYFSNFEELKRIASRTYDSVTYASYYNGDGPITIEEDITIPENLIVNLHEQLAIPKDVTVTTEYGSQFICNSLILEGTLTHEGEYMEVLGDVTVTGSLVIMGGGIFACSVDCGINTDNVEIYSGELMKYQYAQSPDDFAAVAEMAAAESNPQHHIYELYLTSNSDEPNMELTESLTIPGNVRIYVNQGASLTIGENCILTLNGTITSRTDIIVNGTLENNNTLLLNAFFYRYDNTWYYGTLTVSESGTYRDNGSSYAPGTLAIVKGGRESMESAISGLDLSDFDITEINDGTEIYWYLSMNCEPEPGFTDVLSGQYYSDAIEWAVQNNVTTGLSADTFGVDVSCTRGQVVTFLWRAAGCPEPSSAENPFQDVKEDQFYSKAVLWAVEKGITNGLSNDNFGVNDPCNRAQVVTFLWRYAGSPTPASAGNPFTDVLENQFYTTAIAWAVENHVTNGLAPDTFGIDVPCNRAQVVTFLYRAIAE
ncbi:MAG: S-layer homology domain-containing protein [Oscillospiraceae bacterium]|nr:S-layer homology domain-containing protein [Oscillospiraceae bacterium]